MTKTKTDKPVNNQQVMQPDGSITFNFTIPADVIAHGYQEVLQEYVATAEIKGFRKGKAPLAVVEKALDKSKVYGHVLEHVIPPAYSEAIAKNDVRPLIEPRLTPVSMEEGKDWEFKAETAGMPQVELGDYKTYVGKALKDLAKTVKTPKEGEKKDEEQDGDAKLSAALDALIKNAKIAVSPFLIEEETKTAVSKLVNQLNALKLTVDDYAKSIQKSTEELVAEYRKTAETNLKVEFLLSEVVKDIKPEVEEQDPYKKYAAERRRALDFLTQL